MTLTETEMNALKEVLEVLSLPTNTASARARYSGHEPALDSDLAIGLAARTAVMAQAIATADFWALQGGPEQEITLDRTTALYALCSGLFQSVHGHDATIAKGAKAALSNFYRTRDNRWFHPMGTYPGLRDGALALLDCANTPEAIARAIRARDGLELEDAFAAADLAGTMVRSRSEWTAHPQGQALAAAPLVTVEKVANSSPPKPAPIPGRPLSGIRVLDFAHVIAGPVLARTLAETGADCLRVGAPAHLDPDVFLLETGWGKRAAFLDFEREGDLDHMRRLVRESDIFVQSWRPGLMEEWGLTAEELAAHRGPDRSGLIHVSVDSWGRTGPWARRKGFEQLAQSATGVAHTQGKGGPPRYVPTALLADYLAAYLGAAGAVAALHRRAQEGGSYEVRVSLARVTMWSQELQTPGRTAGAPFPPNGPRPKFIERDSAYGRLRHFAPFAQYSHTVADWAHAPRPTGADPALWTKSAA